MNKKEFCDYSSLRILKRLYHKAGRYSAIRKDLKLNDSIVTDRLNKLRIGKYIQVSIQGIDRKFIQYSITDEGIKAYEDLNIEQYLFRLETYFQ